MPPEWWSTLDAEHADGVLQRGGVAARYYCSLCRLEDTAQGWAFQVELVLEGARFNNYQDDFFADADDLWQCGSYQGMRVLIRERVEQRLEELMI